MPGYDTASFVGDAWTSAQSKGFGTPSFWLRYFTPCQTTPLNTSSANANSECDAIWGSNSSSPTLGPITVPAQSRLNGSQAEGHADAQSLCSALTTAYHDVAPLQVPTNSQLYVWLDQEATTALSVSYWNGWSGYIDNFDFGGLGTFPLDPCLYCNPNAAPPSCSTLGNSSANFCYAVWSSELVHCSNTISNPPAWNPEDCSAYTSVPTRLWQFNDGSGGCNNSEVDQDLGGPNFTMANHCFYLSSKP